MQLRCLPAAPMRVLTRYPGAPIMLCMSQPLFVIVYGLHASPRKSGRGELQEDVARAQQRVMGDNREVLSLPVTEHAGEPGDAGTDGRDQGHHPEMPCSGIPNGSGGVSPGTEDDADKTAAKRHAGHQTTPLVGTQLCQHPLTRAAYSWLAG